LPENIQSVDTRRKRYERSPSQEKIIALTPTKVQMLRFLAELRFLSLPQLAKLCCPSERQDLSEKSARRHMREMFDAGLVNVLPVSRAALAPPGAPNDASLLHGSAPNVYAPTAQGLKLLREAGFIGEELLKRPAPAYGPRNSLFLAHELAVRDVRVWLETVARMNSAYHLIRWRDGPDATISVEHSALGKIRPDAWFVYQLQLEPRQAVVVGLAEIDRATERGTTIWCDKVGTYIALFDSGRLRDATGYQNARVLVICPDGQRCDLLAGIIQDHAGIHAKQFWLAEMDLLFSSDLTCPIWRCPGSSGRRSFVPVTLSL